MGGGRDGAHGGHPRLGLGPEADERGQMAAGAAPHDRDPLPVEAPHLRRAPQLVDARPAVVELGRKRRRVGEPVADAGDHIALVGEPGDGAVGP